METQPKDATADATTAEKGQVTESILRGEGKTLSLHSQTNDDSEKSDDDSLDSHAPLGMAIQKKKGEIRLGSPHGSDGSKLSPQTRGFEQNPNLEISSQISNLNVHIPLSKHNRGGRSGRPKRVNLY